jgi:hypothetical protein
MANYPKAKTNDKLRLLILKYLQKRKCGCEGEFSTEGLTEYANREYPRPAMINAHRIGALLKEFKDDKNPMLPVVRRIGQKSCGVRFGENGYESPPVMWQRVK